MGCFTNLVNDFIQPKPLATKLQRQSERIKRDMTVSRKLILTVNVNYTKLQLRKKNFTCWPLNAHMIQLLTP